MQNHRLHFTTLSIGICLASVTAAVALPSLTAQARYGRLDIKDAEGEVVWQCEGTFQGNNGNGLCIYDFPNRDPGTAYRFYRGQVKDGTFTGRGILVYANDDRYEGIFVNGRPQGKGMFLSVEENERYEGDFRNGFFHGRGVFTYANGDQYTGQFAGGQPHGIGEYVYLANGKRSHAYKGQFYLGIINGQGIVTNVEGLKCTGTFYSNRLVGKGTCTFPAKSIFKTYTGELRDGRPEGRGTVIYRDGKKYAGQFRNGVPGLSPDTGS